MPLKELTINPKPECEFMFKGQVKKFQQQATLIINKKKKKREYTDKEIMITNEDTVV